MNKSKALSKSIRLRALEMANFGGGSHIGSVLSIADILGVLYSNILRVRADDPLYVDRDRFILSKGHAGAGVYAALAESNFFPVDLLKTHYQNGSRLSGHVSHKNVDGVEFSTGSLGHGLSVACGIALSGKLDHKKFNTYCLLGDGECDEGSNWEAMLFASHYRLNMLTAIIDYNKLQSLDTVANTMGLEPFREKWESFGWDVIEVDGHSHSELYEAFKIPPDAHKPRCIICHSIKGKGVSFMENSVLWHYRSPQGDEYASAVNEVINSD